MHNDQQREIIRWLKDDWRCQAFHEMAHYLNCEAIPGDILEFGVAGGRGLSMLAYWHHQVLSYWGYTEEEATQRQFIGFDSFLGLPELSEAHPRMSAGVFSHNENPQHPLIMENSPHTPEVVHELFQRLGYRKPLIIEGFFNETLNAAIPEHTTKAALVHIDCDLYESTKEALFAVEPILEDGAIIAFDDWFCYRGNSEKGEARAFAEFLNTFPYWQAISYKKYSVLCQAFILVKKGASSND